MSQIDHGSVAETSCEYRFDPPREVASSDPAVLRAALIRESIERRRAECSAHMQTEVVKLALDLLVRKATTVHPADGLVFQDAAQQFYHRKYKPRKTLRLLDLLKQNQMGEV